LQVAAGVATSYIVVDASSATAEGAETCCVCGVDESPHGNEIIMCEGAGCAVLVHQECYGVREIPRFMAPAQTTAYYMPGSPQRGEPGYFYANTYALDQRPTYEFIPLSLHEAVPGHHFQIALAQELEGVSEFRKDLDSTAFTEGWALYAERLGIEMGFFSDPYDDFGRLLYEMWRATRLVIDTGIHEFGWSREQAIDFMRRNTALSEINIANEVDRYIGWPGQATGYKIGELEIRALRAKAEAALGKGFDIRGFHDAVLLDGPLPLDVLARNIDAWIDAEKSRRK
jgi:prolyl oligopeptidase